MTGEVVGHSVGVCSTSPTLPIFQKEHLQLTPLEATCESLSHPTLLMFDVYHFHISLVVWGILHDTSWFKFASV